MSARDWFHCPFCKKDFLEAKEKYGKIPLKEFLQKLENWDVDDIIDGEPVETVRMDGEEGLNDKGEWEISHSLSCNKCGRSWEIHSKTKPKLDEDEE